MKLFRRKLDYHYKCGSVEDGKIRMVPVMSIKSFTNCYNGICACDEPESDLVKLCIETEEGQVTLEFKKSAHEIHKFYDGLTATLGELAKKIRESSYKKEIEKEISLGRRYEQIFQNKSKGDNE